MRPYVTVLDNDVITTLIHVAEGASVPGDQAARAYNDLESYGLSFVFQPVTMKRSTGTGTVANLGKTTLKTEAPIDVIATLKQIQDIPQQEHHLTFPKINFLQLLQAIMALMNTLKE